MENNRESLLLNSPEIRDPPGRLLHPQRAQPRARADVRGAGNAAQRVQAANIRFEGGSQQKQERRHVGERQERHQLQVVQ